MLIYPDWEKSILSTTSALLRHYGADSAYPALPELDARLSGRPRHVVFLILDGLGSFLLREHLGKDAFLTQNTVGTVTSVYPSTTAAAVTSYTTGLSPLEHGWLGWYLYLKEYASDVKSFLNRSYYWDHTLPGYPVYETLPYETILTRIRRARPDAKTYTIYPPYGANTDRGAEFSWHAKDFGQLCAHVRRTCQTPSETFTFAYWPEPDSTMHEQGVRSEAARRMYAELNRQLERLAAQLKDALLIISSDHGLTDAVERIDIAAQEDILEALVLPPMLESRAAAFYVKSHRRQAFEAAFEARAGHAFRLIPREEVLQMNLFGRGTAHRRFDDFIGDYIACATGDAVLEFSLPHRPPERMTGYHAGLTEQEMLVDVIAVQT